MQKIGSPGGFQALLPVWRNALLHWRTELKNDTRYFSEAEKWNMPDPF
jgi:hypothetical protein